MKRIIPIFVVSCIMMSCGGNADQQAKIDAERSVDSMKSEMAKRQIIDSMNAAAATQQTIVSDGTPTTVSTGAATNGGAPAHNNYTNTTNNNYAATSTGKTTTTEGKKKKGWSAKAKGAVIGAGAITGAMVDGRKGEGAVVGGLIGAAAGLGAGAIIDKKQKQKEANSKEQ